MRPAAKTLRLTLNSGKLSGTLSNVSTVNGRSFEHEWEIKEAKLQGDKMSFTVTHPFEVGHGEVTSSYQGKITGDTIKGTFKTEFLGHATDSDWVAKRVQD